MAPEKIFVAGQAMDSTGFSAVEPAFADAAEILFVGQLEEHKGVQDLLAAFAGVADRRARLRVAGIGSLENQVRAQAELDPRIDLLGHVPHDDLPAELAHARCLVLPAVTTKRYREAWGLVVNEAMAAGVPVIATEAVGAAAGGLVRDGRNGLVVPERRPEALAAAIGRLASDASLARSLGAQARVDVSAFDFPRMAQAFVEAVDHAMTAGPTRAVAGQSGPGTSTPSARNAA